jgi:hypothetical protein
MPEFKIARVVIDAEIGLFADLVVKELCGPRGRVLHCLPAANRRWVARRTRASEA